MDTRLRLRQRLLRIDGDGNRERPSSTPELQRRPQLLGETDGDDDGSSNDDDDDGADEDDNDEDADDEEEASDAEGVDGQEHDGQDSTNGNGTRGKSEKCATSSVIKLLFSRHDAKRDPTVWFDYPPHLQVTREQDVALRCVVVNTSDCPLFYKTYWERNVVKNAFAAAGLLRAQTKKRWRGWNVAWAKHVPKTKFKLLQEHQVFNHVPDPWVIGRKDRLLKMLASYRRRFGSSYAFFPEGFNVPEQKDALRRALARDKEAGDSALWIVKPPASACGRGIRVVPAKDLETYLAKKKHRKLIVQQYLSSPLLLDGYKFDLRVYVVVTSVDPLRIYWFKEGITRLCTVKYSTSNVKNRFGHLTNYSVNKLNDKFVENTDAAADNVGSKWSMTALLAHLHTRGILRDPAQLEKAMRDIVVKTIVAAEAHLTPLLHQYVKKPSPTCYELFGFDLLIDKYLKPWLVEVNVSPSLMGGSPLDRRVKGLLLSDIHHLVGLRVPLSSLPQGSVPQDILQTVQAPAPPLRLANLGGSGRSVSGNASQPHSQFRRRGAAGVSIRQVNKQLHEVVLDPDVPYLDNNHVELFTPADWELVHQMDDEMDRLGHFERVYPCATPDENAVYAPFFTCQRYTNALCAKWVYSKNRLQAKAKSGGRQRASNSKS